MESIDIQFVLFLKGQKKKSFQQQAKINHIFNFNIMF